MNKTKKRSFTVLLCALVCALALVLSLGIFSACDSSESANVDESTGEATWYYGDAEPAEGLGKAGDYYLNTKTLASYVKEGKTWREATAGETGSWYNGTEAPQDTLGNPNDLYLNTKTGELYRKTEGGWGSPLLVLQGKDGREGVIWHSGEGVPGTIEDAREGDFYLDYSEFQIYQLQGDGTWNPLGSLKGSDGVTPTIEGFLTGKGNPTPDLGNNKDFYLNTETGELWQKSTAWVSKGSFGNLSASHIKEIQYNTRSWGVYHGFNKILNRETLGDIPGYYEHDYLYGYWIIFDDNSALFIQSECTHNNHSTLALLYNNDCELGTIEIRLCNDCDERYVYSAPTVTSTANHRYSEEWTSDETDHWHEAVCSHKGELEHKDEAKHTWREYYTPDYDEDSGAVKGYIKWQECRVCGYTTNSKLSDPKTLVDQEGDQKVHIHNADEWETFVKAVNSGATYGEGSKFSEATVELDGDIDFGGLTITPVGLPSNAAKVTDRSNGLYLDLTADAEIQGGFKGTFNGNNNTLSNFVIKGGNFMGLFGYVDGATISNFTIENAKVTGDAFVGAVAGFITGEDVRISAITVKDTTLNGLAHVGGIAGYAKNAGPVLTSANASNDAAIKNCTVQGTWPNPDKTLNSSTQIIAYPSNVTDPADGKYYDGVDVGGILGHSYSSSVIGCYVDAVTMKGIISVGFMVGAAYGTAEAKSAVVGNHVAILHKSNGSQTTSVQRDTLYAYLADGTFVLNKCKNEATKFTSWGVTNTNPYLNHNGNVIDSGNTQGESPYAAKGRASSLSPRSVGEEVYITTPGELASWANRVSTDTFANGHIYIEDNLNMSGITWNPISVFKPDNDPLDNAVFDGQGNTISNLETAKSGEYAYGVGLFGVVTGTFTIQNVTFDNAHTHFHQDEYYGNVVAVVVGYAYGNLTFNNVSVINSEVWGFGKVGALLGMGADPGVHITFNGCTSENNILHGAYNVGGFAGNIQRASDGTDNTVFVKDSGNLSKGNQYILNQKEFTVDAEADFLHNDRTGTTYDQIVRGVYVEVGAAGYLYGGWAEYYISYGSSSYDPLITTGEYAGYRVANSEVCMNEAKTFVHGYVPSAPEA